MSLPAMDTPYPPVHGYRGETPTPRPSRYPRGISVAISREAGSRGTDIAKKVGELLGWQVFSQESLDYLLQNDSAREQFLAEVPQSTRSWVDAHFTRLQLTNKLTADPDTAALIRLLLAVAARGDAVIVGRGAGFLLPVESTVHVRLIAPFERRVAYLAQWLRLSKEEAAAEVHARDERRARFLTATLGRNPTDLTEFDVIVNSDRLGIEGAAQFVCWAIRTKQQFDEIRTFETSPGPAESGA